MPSSCNVCGGTDFRLNDGFMYCKTCGSINENFEEIMQDDEEAVYLNRARIKIKKGENATDQSNLKKKGYSYTMSTADKVKDYLLKRNSSFYHQLTTSDGFGLDESYDYLYRVGVRLTNFSQMLARSASVLVKTMNFPEHYIKVVFKIYQLYLAHCQIAFCDEEIAHDPDHQFTALLENKNYLKELKEMKKNKELMKIEKRKKEFLETVDAWTHITKQQSDDSEEEEEQQRQHEDELMEESAMECDENEMNVSRIKKIQTNLSKTALKKAAKIILNVEFLVVVLYSGALSCGCRNVLLSDFIRWTKEDRFRISQRNINASMRGGHEVFNRETGEGERPINMEKWEKQLKFPLYEIYRIYCVFVQSLTLSNNICKSSFMQIATRLVRNLNLPEDILRRTILLESIVPCDMDPSARRQADIMFGSNLNSITSKVPSLVYDDYMSCFGKIEGIYYECLREEIVLAIETKVMAYILLAIKLSIDVDNQELRDYEEGAELFDIDTWIHQLDMRVKCWQGHDMSKVLDPTCPVPKLRYEYPFGDNAHIQSKIGDKKSMYLFRHRQRQGFQGSVPPKMTFESTYNLPTVFIGRKTRKYEEKDPISAQLTPLAFQTNVLREEMRMNVGEYSNAHHTSVETFFEDFSKKNIAMNEESTSFTDIFPASKAYMKYPQPDWLCNCFAKTERRNCLVGEYRLYLSVNAAQDAYDVAAETFSPRFATILESMALVLGEHVETLFAAFSFLETLVIDGEKVSKVRDDLIDGREISMKCTVYQKDCNFPLSTTSLTTITPIENIRDLTSFYLSNEICMNAENENDEDEEEQEEEDDDDDDDDGGGGDENTDEELDDEDNGECSSQGMRKSASVSSLLALLRNKRVSTKMKSTSYRNELTDKRFFDFHKVWPILSLKYW